MLWIPLLLAAIGPDPSIRDNVPEVAEPSDWRYSFRVSAGGEWDTNPARTLSSASGDGDGLIRLLVDTSVRFDPAPGHRLGAGYLLIAKRFFGAESEDLLVHNLSLSSAHVLLPWLIATVDGAAKMSRIRNTTRDYNLVYGEGALLIRPLALLDIEAHGGVALFTFPQESNYDYFGPRAGGAIHVRPMRGLSLSGGFDWVWRNYDGYPLVKNNESELVFCTKIESPEVECKQRRDTEAQVSIDVIYRGSFVLGGGYLLRLQRSNSDYEQVDRHRVSAFATVGLPFDFTLNVLAALQVNKGISITDAEFLAEDDENQNSLQVGLAYRITDDLVAELRYALFANQFASNDVSFLRQTVYLGLGYRVGR